MDRISLREVRLQVLLGVSDEERSRPQEVLLDLEMDFDTSRAGASDLLTDTVDYSAVHSAIAAVAASRPFHLIESLAESIAASVLREFRFPRVRLLLKKPGALRHRNVGAASVEIERRLHG
jgi:dihydroneopterin aldolase